MPRAKAEPELETCVRYADGITVFQGAVPASRHRRLHIRMLHRHTGGLVELAAGHREPDGKLAITTRQHQNHFLPGGGAGGGEQWLERILALAAEHYERGHELFVSPAERTKPGGHKWNVAQSRWLWLDVDEPERLAGLWDFFRAPTKALPDGRQPHLVIESAGAPKPQDGREVTGGVHALYLLNEPLHAITLTTAEGAKVINPLVRKPPDSDMQVYADPQTGEVYDGELQIVEEIEKANLRLILANGYRYDERGRQVPTVADPACRDRGRVLRLAGTFHGASGRHSRVIFADFARPPYRYEDLVGGLPDPREGVAHRFAPAVRRHVNGGPAFDDEDPYKQISLLRVYEAVTGREGVIGRVRCPARDHEDARPSCDLTDTLFFCHSCGAGGAHYQLVSCGVFGGPCRGLRGEEFKAVRSWMAERFGELTPKPAPRPAHTPEGAGENAHASNARREPIRT